MAVHGELKWQGVDYFLSEALRGEWVGIAKIGEERYEIWFDGLLLGILDKGKRTFYPRLEEKGKEGEQIQGRAKQRAKKQGRGLTQIPPPPPLSSSKLYT